MSYQALLDLISNLPLGEQTSSNINPFLRRMKDPRISPERKQAIYQQFFAMSGRPPEITLQDLVPDLRTPIIGPERIKQLLMQNNFNGSFQ